VREVGADRRDGGTLVSPRARSAGRYEITLLIAGVVVAAAGLLALTASAAWTKIAGDPGGFAALVALTVALALVTVELPGGAKIGVAGIGLLAVGFDYGVGAAVATGIVVAVVHSVRMGLGTRRSLFNGGTVALAAGAGAAAYAGLVAAGWTSLDWLGPAVAAGVAFWAVNIGLLTIAMAGTEGTSAAQLWRERLRWLTPYYLSFGPLALASTAAFDAAGVPGLIAFLVPPGLVLFSVRQYIERTRASLDEIWLRNRDLTDLVDFAAGLAANAHDGAGLVAYAERTLSRLLGTRVAVVVGADAHGVELAAGGERIGALQIVPGPHFDAARWERLREALVPHLATALESTLLVERVRTTHLETIAALSRSMEAKDIDTGGHTERVADIAVAIAHRVGVTGAELDAIHIGALLHDIGKIGIPERILRKPGPLDDAEWAVMKQHPVIAEYILEGIDVPEVVRHIARWSHERIDGAGYPDGLAGDDIPLAAQIVFVADAFDAITSDRPYRAGRSVVAALEEIRANAGSQFAAHIVAALEALSHEEPQLFGDDQPASKVA
jgi:putative nucleotidyltransferase with HDIG domain